jgi:hypothetical protein
MRATLLLQALQQRGIELHPEGDTLRYRAPVGALTDELRAQIQAHKAELLGLLAGTPANEAHVGRHGRPCPQCGDTWQWPTTSGLWVCSWCFVGNPQTAPQFADDGTSLRDSTEG